jgi:PAS domain S-box-containing protein
MPDSNDTATTVIKIPHELRRGGASFFAEESEPSPAHAPTPTPSSQLDERLRRDVLFQQLIENIYDGLLITDTAGVIVEANSRACALFGMTNQEMAGKGVHRLIAGADDTLLISVMQALTNEKFLIIEGSCVHRSGNIFPAEVTVNVLHLESSGYLCFFVRDISKRLQLETDLLRLSKAVESASNAINILDDEGRVVYQNLAFRSLFGLTAEEVNEMGGLAAIFDDSAVRADIIDAITEEDGGDWNGEIEIITEDEQEIAVAVRASAIEDSDGNITGLICVYTDMTEQKHAQRQLREAHSELEQRVVTRTAELQATNEELEQKTHNLEQQRIQLQEAKLSLEQKARELTQASQYKSEFLTNMSHELRTPLNSILILSKMLSANREGHLGKDEVESARVIHSSGSDLLNLINDILDLSKIEAGHMDVHREEVEVAELIDELRGVFTPLAEKNDLNFQLTVAEGTPTHMATDKQRMQQILRNLLSNAFKFTQEGSVALIVSPWQSGDGKSDSELLAFAVTDTGMGIPPEKLDVIFSAFRQADGSTNRRFGGTGLGLSISTELAALLGGHITAESEERIGSTFTLVLPRVCPSQTDTRGLRTLETKLTPPVSMQDTETGLPPLPQMVEAAADDDRTLEGRRILVVDDDMRNVFAIAKLLRTRGVDVLVAENGEKALRLLQDNPDTDAVLMDVMMPVMDGFTATQCIRAKPEFRDLPIIALTAHAMKEDRERCLASGMNDYLAKPLDVDQLIERLHQWLSQ